MKSVVGIVKSKKSELKNSSKDRRTEVKDMENKTFVDLQTIGDKVDGKTIDMVYDTILMQKDAETIFAESSMQRVYKSFFL